MATNRMPLVDALQVVRDARTDQVVITNMGSLREWSKWPSQPLDFHYIPSAMGHSPVLGLGLALAQPQREVIVFTGDGGLLMGLSSLVTIVASRATNLTVIAIDNGIYEVTGGQRTAAASTPVEFVSIAEAAGFATCERFDSLESWRSAIREVLNSPGPRFVQLDVEPVGAEFALPTLLPVSERLRAFREALDR